MPPQRWFPALASGTVCLAEGRGMRKRAGWGLKAGGLLRHDDAGWAPGLQRALPGAKEAEASSPSVPLGGCACWRLPQGSVSV